MTIRWYIMAARIDDINGMPARSPKYFKSRFNPTGLDVPRGWMDYGLMPVFICWADVTLEQHQALIANNDCKHIVLHANIDNQVGAARDAVRAGLEQLDIPGGWVDETDTWRNVLRTVCGVFQYAQKVHGRFNQKIIPDGMTLSTTWSEIPQQGRDFLLKRAAEYGIDTSGYTGAITLRDIYKAFSDAWGDAPFKIGKNMVI